MDDESNPRRRLLQQLAAAAAGGFAAQALAQESSDESVPPLLRKPGSAGADDARYPVVAGEVGVVAPQYPYGHGSRYGIRTDGSDTTAQVKNWRDSLAGMRPRVDPYGLKSAACRGVLPAGTIRITEPGALLDLKYEKGHELWAFVIEGEGARLTTIHYDPKTPGPLMFSANRLYGLVVRNLRFAANDEPAARCDWLVSESAGVQHYFTFENLGFDGAWKAGLRLSGVAGMDPMLATNSECKFDRIEVSPGGFSDGLLCDSNDDGMQSGQFENYWFSNIAVTMSAGTLVRMRRGGHITITNLDASGYKPKQESFLIDLPEIRGSDGAHSLLIRNARFEPLSPHARFLRCRWERGKVVIDGYDDTIERRLDRVSFDLRVSNSVSVDALGKFAEGVSAASAQYWFANARFTGVHRYLFSGKPVDDPIPAVIQYQNCEFCGPWNDPAARVIQSFVRLVPDGERGSYVQRPHIRFRACRVEAVPAHVTDWDLGVQGSRASTTAPIKSLRFGDQESGRLPDGGRCAMVLPPGALVLRVTWILPGGRAPRPGRAYRFELSDGYDNDRRQVLAVFEGADFDAAASRVDLLGHETTAAPMGKGHDPILGSTLVLRETRSPGVHPSAQCIVEFV